MNYNILAIGLGGFIGAISRSLLSSFINKTFPHDIAFGTLGVNIIGSLIIGILFAIFDFYNVNIHLKSFLTTGFLGALTTYSTFAMESFLLFESGLYFFATINVALNAVLSVISAMIGYKVLYFIFSFTNTTY